MSRRYLTNIDLTTSELQNAVIQNLAADPSFGNKDGRIYYNTATDKLRVFANGSWIDVGAITSIIGTTNEIEVSIVDGVATISLPTTINANTTGTAASLTTSRAIELSGDVTGTANFDGSSAINITTTIAANSVALGTDTTGDYVSGVTASDGISASGTGEGASVSLTNTDKGSSQNIFKNVSDGSTSVVADNNNDTLTILGGTGITVVANATTDTIQLANTGVTSLQGTTNQIVASASTGSVTLSLPNDVTFPGTVTLNADPTQGLHAVTKQYVDGIAAGIDWHQAVHLMATSNIPLTGTSGTLVIDGHLALDDADDGYRILLRNQTVDSEEGIYVYFDDGSTYTLSRSVDADTYQELVGSAVFIMEGTVYGATSWMQANHYLTDFSNQNWIQFSGVGTYVSGNGLELNGNVFSIDTAITIDTNSIQTLTNKTLTSPTITNPTVSGLYLSDNQIVIEGDPNTSETTLVFTNPTADRVITFKDQSGTVALIGDIDALTTSDIEEGTNPYFTDERAQDAVGGILGSGLTYSDSTPSIGVNAGQMTSIVVNGVSGNSYGIVGNSTYLDVVNPTAYNSEIELDISAVEAKLTTDGYTKKYSANVGNGSNTSYAITHGLSTRDVIVNVYDSTTYDTVDLDVVRSNANSIMLTFSSPPTADQYRVVIVG
jgi:hypothetical protein